MNKQINCPVVFLTYFNYLIIITYITTSVLHHNHRDKRKPRVGYSVTWLVGVSIDLARFRGLCVFVLLSSTAQRWNGNNLNIFGGFLMLEVGRKLYLVKMNLICVIRNWTLYQRLGTLLLWKRGIMQLKNSLLHRFKFWIRLRIFVTFGPPWVPWKLEWFY